MTSLLPGALDQREGAAGSGADARHRRPLALIASIGGALAASSTLLVCLAVGVVGWFASDAGGHGEPRDGLQIGALGWLMAHGAGVQVRGVTLTVVPLLLTLVSAWAIWRIGLRVGESVSGHGPDADAISDGERDWTVPVAVGLFAVGYVVVVIVTAALAATPETAPSTGRAVGWACALVLLVGGPAIAAGSGRAAIWTAFLPASARAAAHTCLRIVTAHLIVAAVALFVALVLDLGTAVNVLGQLGLGAGEATMLLLVTTLVLPNAMLFSGSYLLGPGFAVGSGTLVAPTAVVLGPLPMSPLLAALPDAGPTPAWTTWLIGLPPLVAAVAAARAQRRHPTVRWEEGALRGCVGGVLAGVVVGFLATLAGGALGPGRMQLVEPFALDTLVHAITAFGMGGLVGGLAMTWWQRRRLKVDAVS